MSPRRKPRSHYAGRRKTATEPSSRVRVYERPDVPGFFMTMAWHTTDSGRPIEEKLPDGVSWDFAVATAEELAAKRRVEILAGRTKAGQQRETTLRQVFEKYFESAEAQEWSTKHRGDYDRAEEFWIHALGAEQVVAELNQAEVEKVARRARMRQGLSPRWERRKLALLRATVRWGMRKARLYRFNPLDGLSLPEYEPDTEDLIYTEAETALLVAPHEAIDWRATLAANIVVDTGRRISAILHLTIEDVRVSDDRAFLQFRKEWDKRRRGALRPVSMETAELLAEALQRPEVRECGWLFPEGRLEYDDPRDKPLGKDAAIDALHAAEDVLAITQVAGRAFHGLKRRHVTTAMEVSHGDTGLVGDQTGNVSDVLLRLVYRKASRRRLTTHVDRVRQAVTGDEDTREDTRAESPSDEDAPNDQA